MTWRAGCRRRRVRLGIGGTSSGCELCTPSVYSRNTDCNGLDFDRPVGGGIQFGYRGVLMLVSPLDGTIWLSSVFGAVGPAFAGVVGAAVGLVRR